MIEIGDVSYLSFLTSIPIEFVILASWLLSLLDDITNKKPFYYPQSVYNTCKNSFVYALVDAAIFRSLLLSFLIQFDYHKEMIVVFSFLMDFMFTPMNTYNSMIFQFATKAILTYYLMTFNNMILTICLHALFNASILLITDLYKNDGSIKLLVPVPRNIPDDIYVSLPSLKRSNSESDLDKFFDINYKTIKKSDLSKELQDSLNKYNDIMNKRNIKGKTFFENKK